MRKNFSSFNRTIKPLDIPRYKPHRIAFIRVIYVDNINRHIGQSIIYNESIRCILEHILRKTKQKRPSKVSCHGDSPEHPLITYTPPNLDLLPQLKTIAGITKLETSKIIVYKTKTNVLIEGGSLSRTLAPPSKHSPLSYRKHQSSMSHNTRVA